MVPLGLVLSNGDYQYVYIPVSVIAKNHEAYFENEMIREMSFLSPNLQSKFLSYKIILSVKVHRSSL